MSDGWKTTLAQAFGWIGVLAVLAIGWHYNTAQTLELRKLCIEQKGSWTGDTCVFVGMAGAQ